MQRWVRYALALAVTVLGMTAAAAQTELPAGPGRELVYGSCQTCHSLETILASSGISRRAWSDVLDSMRTNGLRIDDDRRAAILEYLATYLGPDPPPPPPEVVDVPLPDGGTVYAGACVGCHQADGSGIAGVFPPLAGNADLFLAADLPALVVLYGLTGPINVNGVDFNGTMPAFGFLSDAEVAAVINYLRSNFGNDALAPADSAAMTAADVTALRSGPVDSATAVHDYRQSLQ